MHDSRHGKNSEGQGLDHGNDLRNDQYAMAIPAVCIDAGNRREEEDGDLAGKTDYAQKKCRIGKTVDEPAHGDLLHPCPDERNALTAEEEPVISMVQSPENEFCGNLFI